MNAPFSRPIRVGSRPSPLALKQVKEVFSLLEAKGIKIDYELIPLQTQGDKDKTTSLTVNPADDFFTDTLDRALLDKIIDIAVHSAKDLPKNLHSGIAVFALTKTLDDTDAFVGRKKLSELAPGSKVGTSSLLRQKGIKALNPNVEIVDVRGTIEERMELLQAGKIDGLIVASCALKRLGLENKITEILPWEATALQGQLAVTGRAGEKDLQKVFAAMDVRQGYGKVILVGAGPGDADLITVKGVKALRSADCVFYDYLAHPDLLQYALGAEKIFVGKRKGDHVMSQAELSRQLKEKALHGKNVVRLKGGDPLIFGRGADEIEYLRSYHIQVEIIPGVSSATGLPSSLGIPLTARGVSSSVAFISGHAEEEKVEEDCLEIPKTDTVVFLMGLSKLSVIVKSLKTAGWKNVTPILVISKGSRADEKVISGNLDDIESKVQEAQLEPPALIVVGEVVKFWRSDQKDSGNILFLGTNPDKYKGLGRILHHPMIKISPTELSENDSQALLDHFKKADIILLTSRFGVMYFLEWADQYALMDDLGQKDIAVIGEDTAWELEFYGLTPKLQAEEETSAGLFKLMEQAYDLKGKTVLFPRSSLSNPYLTQELSKKGAKVMEFPIYKNIKPEKKELPKEPIAKIIFTSPSTVQNFLEDYGRIPEQWQILAKGPATQEALDRAGYRSEVLVFE